MRTQRVFAYRSFQPELETVRRFASFGVDAICVFPSNTYNSLGLPYCSYGPTWIANGVYDFAPLDRQLRDQLEANPRAKFLCMIDLNTPLWWHRRMGPWEGAYDSFSALGMVANMTKWREGTRDYLQTFLRHTESNVRDHMLAYILSCGSTSEWYDGSLGLESPSRRAAWRQWRMEHGDPDPVDVPPASVREQAQHGLIRDPVRDELTIDYWRFVSRQVGDAILYFAQAAQDIIRHRVEVGLFYGYAVALSHAAYVGHLDGLRVSRSDLIDFFIAPASYSRRAMGQSTSFLAPVASFKHNGKGFIQELDHRTHTSRSPDGRYNIAFGIWKNELETIAGLRREFAYALIEDVSLWWFDMWGGFYESPNVRAALAQMKQLWDRYAGRGGEPAAQIAVVIDAESRLHVNPQDQDPAGRDHAEPFYCELGLAGAPYKVYEWEDLETLDLTPFRLIIFPQLVIVDAARRNVLNERVCCDGRTVLWCGPAGVIRDGTYDLAHVEALTGLPAKGAGIAEKQMMGWRSVLSPRVALSAREFRDIARAGGVHLYDETDEPLYANQRLMAFHTATGGKRRFRLPEPHAAIRELFTGRLVARNTAEFEDDLAAPDSALYALE